MDEREYKKHPSYGTISISRVNSSADNQFFGSSITHNNFIALRIHEASIAHNLNRDWIHAEKVLVEVYMSQSQFAEAITSLNMGDGTPCTIHRLMGKGIEPDVFENKRIQFEKDFDHNVRKINERTSTMITEAEKRLLDSKPLSKAEKAELLGQLRMIKQDINSNLPFVQKSFNEQMDKTVLEAKGEIEAFVENKIHSAGLEHLKSEIKVITE
jgi:hypothetical protein